MVKETRQGQVLLLLFLLTAVPDLVESFSAEKQSKAPIASTTPTPDHGLKCNPTCVILKVSYDGGRFTGWSSTNDKIVAGRSYLQAPLQPPTRRVMKKLKEESPKGFVRSVEGVLKLQLSKLFAHIDENRIILEASSRTDKGVHADAAIVQAYVLAPDVELPIHGDENVFGGKRRPHPKSAFDTDGFLTFRKDPPGLMYVLNRMLPHDVRIRGVALMPTLARPFHATLDAVSKTYEYNLSVGRFHDPTKWRKSWHIGSSAGPPPFDIDSIRSALAELEGQHDFAAFRGAPRGREEKRRMQQQTTICHILEISFKEEIDNRKAHEDRSYVFAVTGDRFLYKMVRFMVGSLVAIGVGRLSVDDLKRAIETGTWDSSGSRFPFECAPPQGLRLKKVDYATSLKWMVD